MPFKESQEGQTHSYNDNCDEPIHNDFLFIETFRVTDMGLDNDKYSIVRKSDLTNLFTVMVKEIINELESNPNEDGSATFNVPHWIEKKQSQLRKIYLETKVVLK